MKKLLPYLILNVLVSAITMLIVLMVWNKTHPAQTPTSSVNLPTLSVTVESASDNETGLPPLDQPVLEVQAVIVPGDLETERVLIRNLSSQEVALKDWQLTNGSGDEFTFPVFTLFPGGSVSLYSRSGQDTALELFWGLTSAAWQSGTTVTILDPQGNQRAQYKIP